MSIIHHLCELVITIANFLSSSFNLWLWLLPRLILIYLDCLGMLAGYFLAPSSLPGLAPSLLQTSQVYAASPTPTAAPTPTPAEFQPTRANLLFADDFEHGLDQWQLARGRWDDWHITSDGWLQADLPKNYSRTELVPVDQVWQPQWLNYQFEFDFIPYTRADKNWAWGYADIDNWYEIHFYRGLFHVARVREGRALYDFDGGYGFQLGEIYHAKIIFNQGRIQIWINDKKIIDHQDYTYENNGGKIALKATTGAAYPTQVAYDNIRLYSLQPTFYVYLPITDFKQYQPPWRDFEYDHAESWLSRAAWPEQDRDRTTIYHWGCALISLASIFDYYELKNLPDGTPLNPASLNVWLKKQADGYLGEGNLNWLTATRLSRLIQEQHATQERPLPNLEYERDFTPSQTEIQTAIDNNRPQIIQIPGHFLTAHGYIQDEDDLIIADPAYTYTRFSQHQADMVSSIDFSPSQTDLSYLLAVYSPSLSLDFFQDDQIITDSFLAQDTLADQFYDYQQLEETAQAAIHSAPVTHYLAKPDSGEYQLKLTSSNQVSESDAFIQHLQLLAYDQAANYKMFDWYVLHVKDTEDGGNLANEDSLLAEADFSFDKQDLVQAQLDLQVEFDYRCLANVINAQPQLNPYLNFRLLEILNFAEQASSNTAQQRYQQLFFKLLFAFQAELLTQFLQELNTCF
jgi:hypothetical protein